MVEKRCDDFVTAIAYRPNSAAF